MPQVNRRRRSDGLRAVLARAVPRRIAELGVEVDYVVIHLYPRRTLDPFITLR